MFNTEKVDMHHSLSTGLRSKLLAQGDAINESTPDGDDDGYTDASGKISLGKMLQKIKDSQSNNDDNFRA